MFAVSPPCLAVQQTSRDSSWFLSMLRVQTPEVVVHCQNVCAGRPWASARLLLLKRASFPRIPWQKRIPAFSQKAPEAGVLEESYRSRR